MTTEYYLGPDEALMTVDVTEGTEVAVPDGYSEIGSIEYAQRMADRDAASTEAREAEAEYLAYQAADRAWRLVQSGLSVEQVEILTGVTPPSSAPAAPGPSPFEAGDGA